MRTIFTGLEFSWHGQKISYLQFTTIYIASQIAWNREVLSTDLKGLLSRAGILYIKLFQSHRILPQSGRPSKSVAFPRFVLIVNESLHQKWMIWEVKSDGSSIWLINENFLFEEFPVGNYKLKIVSSLSKW